MRIEYDYIYSRVVTELRLLVQTELRLLVRYGNARIRSAGLSQRRIYDLV